MIPTILAEQASVLPPAYYRVQARLGSALHIDTLTFVRTLHGSPHSAGCLTVFPTIGSVESTAIESTFRSLG
jgi:hypothetical protein